MADLSKPLCTMKRILILLLALMPIMVNAQEYIDMDQSTATGRTVVTKPATIISGDDAYLMRFVYSKLGDNEMYYTTLIFSNQESAWIIAPNSIGTFHMASGKDIKLKTLIDSESQRQSNGKYMITSSYIIPTNNAQDMLDALLRISVKTSSGDITIPIDFDTASFLMMSYLELLSKTGR